MIPRPTSGGASAAEAVTSAALQSYATVCPLFGSPTLPYDAARAHTSGDALADFLVIELTEGAEGDSDAARFERAAQQVDYAIGSLQHVATQLHSRAMAAASLSLPLAAEEDVAEPMFAGAGAAAGSW